MKRASNCEDFVVSDDRFRVLLLLLPLSFFPPHFYDCLDKITTGGNSYGGGGEGGLVRSTPCHHLTTLATIIQ